MAEVIARRHIGWGFCDLTIGEIATLAGVSVRTVQRVLRRLEALGWVTITERARFRQPSLTNVVRIVSVEWTAWLAKRPKGVRSGKGGRVTGWQATSDKQALEERKTGRASPIREAQHHDPPPDQAPRERLGSRSEPRRRTTAARKAPVWPGGGEGVGVMCNLLVDSVAISATVRA